MGPPIAAVPVDAARPAWSVMIPTFNCARFLTSALGSVLSQDPGPEVMQIEVIDDCSSKDDPETVTHALAGSRVKFYRQPNNVGATANFNTCLDRSLGHLVHILHGDDYVLPGFYDRLELSVRRHPQVSFFCTRAFVVDVSGQLESMSERLPTLEATGNDVAPLLYRNPFCTPSIVVRRRFYETLGGFLPELVHTADWEMWVRAIGHGGGCAINQPLACYRWFAANETSRMARTADNLRAILHLGDI